MIRDSIRGTVSAGCIGLACVVLACSHSQDPVVTTRAEPAIDDDSFVTPQTSGMTVRQLESELRPPTTATQTPVALQAYFQIWRFLVPPGSVSASPRLWNHLEESGVGIAEALNLRNNGLRIGVGNASTWPAVRSVLQDIDALTWNQAFIVDLGTPLCIEMGPVPDQRPIFRFTPDGALTGARESAGRLCLRVDHFMDLRRPGRSTVTVTPEIRRPKPVYAWDLAREGGQVPREQVQSFEDLAATLRLEPGEYLLIGPSQSIQLTHLMGSVLLKSQHEGVAKEILICIVPKIIKREIPTQDAGRMIP